jgi:hypothetical protein
MLGRKKKKEELANKSTEPKKQSHLFRVAVGCCFKNYGRFYPWSIGTLSSSFAGELENAADDFVWHCIDIEKV